MITMVRLVLSTIFSNLVPMLTIVTVCFTVLAIITAKIFKQYDYEKLVKYNLPRLNDISKDIKSIRSRLPATVTSKLPLISDDLENLSTFSPDEHDVIIWLGDLNYRIIEGELTLTMTSQSTNHSISLCFRAVARNAC